MGSGTHRKTVFTFNVSKATKHIFHTDSLWKIAVILFSYMYCLNICPAEVGNRKQESIGGSLLVCDREDFHIFILSSVSTKFHIFNKLLQKRFKLSPEHGLTM